ncbi:MAG: helix-turn-helix domain-containing protein [Dehalococcoidia bacterium]|jgi:predicted ArsR family transcriptional regulator
MQSTRQDILDYLRRQGQGSVKDLGQLLGLTATGIRQHLTILERDGLIEGHQERGRVGRPALVYSLTQLGDGLYPKRYDVLAAVLLEEMEATAGGQAMQELLQRAAGRFADAYRERMEGKTLQERVEEVTHIIQGEGSLAATASDGGDYLIHRFTCPYPEVARAHGMICDLDLGFVGRLLNASTKLDACMMRGDRACTYRVRPSA